MYRLAVHPRAEAPGRAHSPFLLRLGHPVAGHKVLCTSNVARGAPWARHPPAGHERAPNCASTGRSRVCLARHKCRRKVGGVRERHHGVFRGVSQAGHPALGRFCSLPSPAQWPGEVGPGMSWNGIIFAPEFCGVFAHGSYHPGKTFSRFKKISLSSGVM